MPDFSQTILKVFDKSPLSGIWHHMSLAKACCTLLPDFIAASQSENWSQAQQLFKKISDTESEADKEKKAIILQLHHRLFLPVSRLEAISLLQSQDSMANQAEDIAGIIISRRLVLPSHLTENLLAYTQSAVTACHEAKKVVDELDHAQTLMFSRGVLEHLAPMVEAIDASEHINDRQQRELRADLMACESELKPIEVMFMYDVIARIGRLADCAHHIGSKFIMLMT